MKAIANPIYNMNLLMSLLLCLCLPLTAQDRSLFKTQYQANQIVPLDTLLTVSDTISLKGGSPIYALCIDAKIYQPREASFTRIVLEDVNGNNYIVAESDWFCNDTTEVILKDYCEETTMLNGIIPKYLKCYVAGGAMLSLNRLSTSNKVEERKNLPNSKQIKEAQVRDIATRINAYNEKHGKLWQAGVTDIAQKRCTQEDIIYSGDSYINNLKYYIDGFYEFGERQQQKSRTNSPFVNSFDWRNRHGKNWITSIKNQDPSGLCTAFAAVATTEAAAKLYFNIEDEIDLSEYAVGYYSGVSYYGGIMVPLAYYPIRYIRDYGAVDESTAPFPDHYVPLPEMCPQGNECMKIFDYIQIPASLNNVDSIKYQLIHKGPAQSGLHNLNHCHAMSLVGYGEITADTIYHFIYKYNKDTVYAQTSEMIGKDFWIFKNSYGVNDVYGHQGYAYYVFNDYQYMLETIFPITPITSLIYSEDSINVTDADGDGLFNWGIGPKPAHCPAWTPDESDGDDSDRTKGHMSEYGFCEVLPNSHPVYEYIANDSILTNSANHTAYLGILRGATVTLQSQQNFDNGTKLLLDRGATLILDGTTITGNYLQPYAGSKIILNNGGRISMPFEVPLGVELVINRGSIE